VYGANFDRSNVITNSFFFTFRSVSRGSTSVRINWTPAVNSNSTIKSTCWNTARWLSRRSRRARTRVTQASCSGPVSGWYLFTRIYSKWKLTTIIRSLASPGARLRGRPPSFVCRTFGQKRRRSRFVRRSVHQNQPVPGIGSGHLLFEGERSHAGPEGTGFRHRWIWLYDVYRKFRTTTRVRGERDRIGKSAEKLARPCVDKYIIVAGLTRNFGNYSDCFLFLRI